jgi:hypothetical protein
VTAIGVPEFGDDFEAALHEAARAATGLENFGGSSYLLGLRRLIAAYATDLPDDLAIREACFAMTLPGLVGRLHSERGWAEHPQCLGRPIERPLVIAGIPRTGTTALHMLLAQDPQFQGLERWLIPNPIVRPARALWDAHPFHRAAIRSVQALVEASPTAMAVHGIGADDVDECLALMMQEFVTNQLPSLLDLPSYDAWFLEQDEAPSYHRLADNLRLIGFAESEKTWLLKNPTHLLRMETLLAVFPDARVIHTHRDPVTSIVSTCKMLAAFRGNPLPGSPAARAIGPRQLRVYKRAVEHTMAVRKRFPEQFHDVHQNALLENPMDVVRGVYAFFKFDLDSEAEARMRRWIKEHPAPRRADHEDAAADFGLTEAEIRREFAAYAEHYGL